MPLIASQNRAVISRRTEVVGLHRSRRGRVASTNTLSAGPQLSSFMDSNKRSESHSAHALMTRGDRRSSADAAFYGLRPDRKAGHMTRIAARESVLSSDEGSATSASVDLLQLTLGLCSLTYPLRLSEQNPAHCGCRREAAHWMPSLAVSSMCIDLA